MPSTLFFVFVLAVGASDAKPPMRKARVAMQPDGVIHEFERRSHLLDDVTGQMQVDSAGVTSAVDQAKERSILSGGVVNDATPAAIEYMEAKVNAILDKTVFTIKTHNRPECLLNILRSIVNVNRSVPVIVGDDGDDTYENESRKILGKQLVSYLQLPIDSGTGYGRNRMVEEAKRRNFEYFIMADDDFSLSDSKLLIDLASRLAAKDDIDVIAPVRCDYDWKSKVKENCQRGVAASLIWSKDAAEDGGKELFVQTEKPSKSAMIQSDLLQQFFLAKINVGPVWDDLLKNNDHYDAMLTMKENKIQSYIDTNLKVSHKQNRKCAFGQAGTSASQAKYDKVRKERWMELMPYVLHKWSVSNLYDEVGRIWFMDKDNRSIKTACGVSCDKHRNSMITMDLSEDCVLVDGHWDTEKKCVITR